MSVEALLSRLEHVRPNGKGRWRSCCPAHGGKNRSALSIYETPDGAVLLHCHVMGCAVGDIAGAVGVDLSELFPPRADAATGSKPIARPWPSRVVLEALHMDIRVAFSLFDNLAKSKPTEITAERAKEYKTRMLHLINELDRSY